MGETMSALQAEKSALKSMADQYKQTNDEKDVAIAELTAKLKQAEDALSAYLNRLREDKQTQTDLSAKWIDNAKMQLANLDNVFAENEELRKLASKNDDRLLELADENKILLD